MSDYQVSRIFPTDKRALAEMDALLAQEGIERDRNLDYMAGLFDNDYKLVATGSCFKNTLRCFAVDHNHQGEGLLNAIISHLIDYQYEKGNLKLFLYTKINSAKFFGDIGFYEIARVEDKLVFMENRRNGFQDYLQELAKSKNEHGKSGAVVMNANPFTLGHLYLLEKAAAACDTLHVFVVEEEASPIPFAVRYALVKAGSAHLKNLVYHSSGSYIISSATFPSYFLKDSQLVIESQAKLDIQIFAKIAQALNVTERFVGDEPFSEVTSIYNSIMTKQLPASGINCTVIPRKEGPNGPISASKVRQALKEGSLDTIKDLVPATTYAYFASPEAEPILTKLRALSNVIHY
jgi:[citrate (pro-3S)-lyase] ligase